MILSVKISLVKLMSCLLIIFPSFIFKFELNEVSRYLNHTVNNNLHLQLSINYAVYPYISNFPKQYPVQFRNDSGGLLRIKFEKIEFPYEVKIFDRNGKELSNAMFTFQKEVALPLHQYERGSYIIAVYTSSKKLYDYSMLLIK
jgi:hypothetical protein